MLFGLLQFWLAQEIFGDLGTKPVINDDQNSITNKDEPKPHLQPTCSPI